MKLVESIMTRNPCCTAGRKITVKGLMLHSVGCPQPKASAFINSWNSPSHGSSCVHGFIDGNDGTVYQTLPWNHRGWHCGSGNKGSGNNTHIGVEMCEPACIRYTAGSNFTCSNLTEARAVAERTYKAAVGLFAMLCNKYGLDPLADGVVISHREGHSRGIASNHGDPEHLWAQLGTGYTMDSFRKAVKAAMGSASSGTDGYTKIMGNTRAVAFQPYLVRVSIPDLNIREAPGTDKPKTRKVTGMGVFTIVEEADGKGASRWGLLKSYREKRNGWISLDHASRI